MIKIEVHSTRAVIRSQEPLTVGLTGATARFSFGKHWETLIKTAVFRQGDKTVTLADIGTEVIIPWEVLTVPGVPVYIGVYGTDGTGAIAIPTVWAQTQPVRPGADPEGDPATEPTPGLWEQMQGKLGSLEQLRTDDKSSLVAAINEANRAVFAVPVDGTEGNYSTDCTMIDLLEAWKAGKTLLCFWKEHSRWMSVCQAFVNETGVSRFGFSAAWANQVFYIWLNGKTGTIAVSSASQIGLATEESKLPNPKKLTFIGAATAEYDGSEEVVVGIPSKVSHLVNDSGYLTEAPVTSVNGQTGDVHLTIPSVVSQLANDKGYLTEAPVTSVNGKTGAVTLDVPTKTSDLTNDSGFLTSVPVTSVNGKTGAVTVEVPTKTSDLENNSGYLTEAPVTSVNGKTGDVTVPTAVKVTVTQTEGGTYTADLSCGELLEAYNAGSTVYCQHGSRVLPMIVASKPFCVFGCVHGGNVHTVTVGISAVTVTAVPLASGGSGGLSITDDGEGNVTIT